MGRDSFLAGAHEIDRHYPFIQGNSAAFKDRSDSYGELLAAFFALVNSRANGALAAFFGFQGIRAILPAVGANGAIGPADRLDKFAGLFLVHLCDCHPIWFVHRIHLC